MTWYFAVRGLLLCVLTTSVLGSHFRGAIFMVRPSPGGGENEMEVFFHISWRRSSGSNAYCNQSVIDSGILIGQSDDLDCHRGCSESTISNVTFMCTDFSIEEDWTFGERIFVYTFNEGPDITILYTGGDWISPFGSRWSILTKFSTARRSNTGHINSTPRAITSPVLRLQENCSHIIRIPVTDPDNDIVRCRWAIGEDECGGICDGFPGAELDPDACSITYTANQGVGFQAAAIVIEDFLSGSTVPMSSVGLQFLVLVFNSTRPCSVAPEFIPPTLEDDSCVAIPPGGTFHTMLVAESGYENDIITEIQTVSPAGMEKSDLFQKKDSNTFYVNITWTPTADQENDIYLFCFSATNFAGLSSSQICIQLLPGHTAPAPIQETATPNMGLVRPCDLMVAWNVNFDGDVERPATIAYITFHNSDTDIVEYRIDTFSSSEVEFINGSMIELTPDHIFEENTEYYINLDRGVVIGVEGCRLGNEPVTGRQFWTFKTLNITSPETPGETLDCECETPVYVTPEYERETPDCRTPDYVCESCTSCTIPLTIGAIIGTIGVLVGISGLIIGCVTAKRRKVRNNKAEGTTGDNPAYALSGCNEKQGESKGEHEYVQSPPAAPENPVYENVFIKTLERSRMH